VQDRRHRNDVEESQTDRSFYTSCRCNCGATSQCVFKAHMKNGVVVAVEPDDRFNKVEEWGLIADYK